MIDPEEFAAWREHPITRWTLEAMSLKAEDIRATYMHVYFHNDPKVEDVPQMNFQRGLYAAYSSIAAVTHAELTQIYAEADER